MNKRQHSRIVNQLAEIRALVDKIPSELVSDPHGDDFYITTLALLDQPDPEYHGLIYAEDEQGKAIAQMVVWAPTHLRQLLAIADQLLGEVEVDERQELVDAIPVERRLCLNCQHGYQFAPGEWGCSINAAMRCKPEILSRQWMLRQVTTEKSA